MEKEPSLTDWQRIYKAAQHFKEAAPWQWMSDSQIFGVWDPAGETVGYCSVLGKLGKALGLVAYLGSEGLASYSAVARARRADDFEAHARQNCLSLLFTSRSELSEKDRAVIRALGLKFRGKNEWPVFRRQRPGYYPWYLTAEEARLFGTFIEQATAFCLQLKDDPHLLDPPRRDVVLVRVYHAQDGWRSTWLRPPPHRLPVMVPNELGLKRLESQFRRSDACWETGFFYLPAPVKEEGEERPYFPLVILWVDRASGLVLHVEMAKPGQWQVLAESFVAAVTATQTLPAKIVTPQEELAVLFQDLAAKLGTDLKKEKGAKGFNAAKKGLLRDIGRRF